MKLNQRHPADQIVELMHRIYSYGMTTTSGGNLSIRDDDGAIWISPGGVDKGSLTRRDIVCVRPDGTVEGIHKPSSEFPFHRTVYQMRPDLGAIVHAHPPALVAFSIARKVPQTRLLAGVAQRCGRVEYAPYALPGSQLLGDTVAGVFASGVNTVLLENHGVVVGSTTLLDAFLTFETLDFTARLELEARRVGTPRPAPDETRTAPQWETFTPGEPSSAEKAARQELCQFAHRAYDQQLISSTQGTLSCRLPGGAFLITPAGVDKKELEPADLVRIEGPRAEAGKRPSASADLHRAIYEAQPHVQSIVLAQPPSVMVFAVTDVPFDSRTIPESYILLRSIPRLAWGTPVATTAATLVPRTPLALVSNECLVVTGSSNLNAFDRLEVAEYSARALIAAKSLGEVVTIEDRHIEDLVVAFQLPR